jgi:hypothetical protein
VFTLRLIALGTLIACVSAAQAQAQTTKLSQCLELNSGGGYDEIKSTCSWVRGEFAFSDGTIVAYTFDERYRRGRFSTESYSFRREFPYNASNSTAARNSIRLRTRRIGRQFLFEVLNRSPSYIDVEITFSYLPNGPTLTRSNLMAAPAAWERVNVSDKSLSATVTRAVPDPP